MSLSSKKSFEALFSDSVTRRVVTGLSKLSIALKSQSWKKRERDGLTPTQSQILSVIASQGRNEVPLSLVASTMGITSATASDSVSSLLIKKLITKNVSQNDSRAMTLALTTQGRRMLRRNNQWPDLFLSAVETLSGEEKTTLLKTIIKMIRTLQEQGGIATARMCTSCKFFRPNVYENKARPHHCLFVDAPFGDNQLQIDCPDFNPVSPEKKEPLWNRFITANSTSK